MEKKTIIAAGIIIALLSGLGSAVAAAGPPAMVKVLIGFDRQPGPEEEGLVRAAGGAVKYRYHLIPAIAASVPEAALPGLQRNPQVTIIEPDIKVYAVDAELDNTWGVKRIGAGAVHAGANTGGGVKVAVIDSGIDYRHSDTAPFYKGGYDFVNEDSDPMDDNGHGTHVAGTVAAFDNGLGVVGAAPSADLYALKVLGADGSGSYSDVIAALQWAVDHGLLVTNNSYGGSGYPGDLVKAAFDNSYNNYGLLHVAAAGNSGNTSGTGDNAIYPARWGTVIAVAATSTSDARASWSSTGPAVELAAPGVAINSTLMGGSYGTMSGTSMASPHVAAVAALVLAAGIADVNGNGFINDDVRLRLQNTADDRGVGGRDTMYGFGLVNAVKAVALTSPPPATDSLTASVQTNKLVYRLGETVSITVAVKDTAGIVVSGAAVHIDITTASGKQYTGDGTTGAKGTAVFKVRPRSSDGKGIYTVTATASKSGYELGTGGTSFLIQ